MKVGKLKEMLNDMDDDNEVMICVNTPAGYVCPDGAVVGIRTVCRGIDWHMGLVTLVPEYRLNVDNVEVWAKRKEEI